jgi:ureidoglycolate hydrolase
VTTTELTPIRLTAAPLTAAAWAPFGWLPVYDTDPVDPTLQYEFAWNDPHVNFITHFFDEVEHTDDGETLCDVMYRHDTHTQSLMPINVDSILAVAPAGVDFSKPEDFDTVRAFIVHPLEALTLYRGTWHWGPFPLDAEPIRLFNVQGKRYAEDNASVDLPAHGGRFVIDVGGTAAG